MTEVTATQTLTEFLLARIAEDEEHHNRFLGATPPYDKPHRRMLAECEAKRRIVDEHQLIYWGSSDGQRTGVGCTSCHDWRRYPDLGRAWVEHVEFPCPTIRALAAVYSDHPDFQDEWRP